jgi:hypothetical protein
MWVHEALTRNSKRNEGPVLEAPTPLKVKVI